MAERPGNDPAHPREQITRTNTSIAKINMKILANAVARTSLLKTTRP